MQPQIITCSVESCARPSWGHGFCNMHYQRWRKSPEGASYRETHATKEQRFWLQVEKTDTCWLWTGHISKAGYGYFESMLAHHFLIGKPPTGFEADHLCFRRNCVRPDHLEVVTRKINIQRQRIHGRGKQPTRPCSNPGCDVPAKGLGMCWKHYMQVWRARKKHR